MSEEQTKIDAVLRAAKVLSIKWTTNGQDPLADDFMTAIECVHKAICALYGIDHRRGFKFQEPVASPTPATER